MARQLVQDEHLDWKEIEQLIWREALGPLFFYITRGQDLLSPTFEQQLERAYAGNAIRNHLLLSELVQVIGNLTDVGIPVVVLKGAALLQEVYGNTAVRPMRDIDILVREEDIVPALKCLLANEYRSANPEVHTGMTVEYENEVLLFKPGQVNVILELHWQLLDFSYYQDRMDMGWYWETASPARFGEVSSLVLGPEALLLHLCSHLSLHHGGEGLRWLHDVAEVLYHFQDKIMWESLFSQAASADLVLPLQQILPRVSDRWQVPFPDRIRKKLSELVPSAAELKVFRQVTAEDRPFVQHFWAEIVGIIGWRRRIRYVLGHLFPSIDYMRQRYDMQHTYLLPFYYLYRWYQGSRRSI